MLSPQQDTVIYVGDATADLTNGDGYYLFVGKAGLNREDVQPRLHRSLLRFDLSAIPRGATVLSGTLTLVMDRSAQAAGERAITVHRLSASWGEGKTRSPYQEGYGGDAASGDATARERFAGGTAWQTQGGDFVATASATRTVAAPGTYSWGSSPGLVADLQAWVTSPTQNAGWILIGDEPLAAVTTSKRFGSRTHPQVENRPKLTLRYSVPVWRVFLPGLGR